MKNRVHTFTVMVNNAVRNVMPRGQVDLLRTLYAIHHNNEEAPKYEIFKGYSTLLYSGLAKILLC